MDQKIDVTRTDIDSAETQEWLEALEAVLERDGPERAHFLLNHLVELSRRSGALMPFDPTTEYINTIPPHLEAKSPGDHALEWRIRTILRWNAMAMVVRANRKPGELGGHIASFASSATLYDVGFNHFWHAPTATHPGDLLYIQGHSSPGVYARAFLEGRLSADQLDHFRMEVDGKGISSYPHPWLMPDFWQFPTGSMGLGPINAIYQARFLRYLEHRGLQATHGRRVWGFFGDGEMDEPESIGALSLAARERLDNLTIFANGALIRSTIDLSNTASYDSTRALQGQSPYIINAGVTWTLPDWGLATTLVYNVIGDRVAQVGTVGYADVYERHRNLLDAERTAFGGLLGLDTPADVIPAPFIPLTTTPVDTSVVVGPELEVLHQRITAAEQAHRVERNSLLPDLMVGYFNQTLIGAPLDAEGTRLAGPRDRFQGFQLGDRHLDGAGQRRQVHPDGLAGRTQGCPRPGRIGHWRRRWRRFHRMSRRIGRWQVRLTHGTPCGRRRPSRATGENAGAIDHRADSPPVYCQGAVRPWRPTTRTQHWQTRCC